jgi:tRNA pseudouridine38-40 synthase
MKYFYNTELIYDGQNYYGWQKQKKFDTVQGTVEKALEVIAKSSKIKTIASSRTDTAVHSRANVCFIKIEEDLEPHDLLSKLNHELPKDIRVSRCERTYNHFKVIYFAEKKQYLYLFKNIPSDISSPYFHNIEQPLDIEKMKNAASIFLGSHDFTNFCHKVAKTTDKVREILKC